jgi:hypothetical protein
MPVDHTDSGSVPTCQHCYHADGYVFTTYPASYPEVCCQCGDRRMVRPAEPPPPPGHGPFYPQQARWPYPYTTTTGGTSRCSCRPENGGSGICGCVLGGPTITY